MPIIAMDRAESIEELLSGSQQVTRVLSFAVATASAIHAPLRSFVHRLLSLPSR